MKVELTRFRVFQSMRDLASAAIEASSFGIVCAPDRSSMNWRGWGLVNTT